MIKNVFIIFTTAIFVVACAKEEAIFFLQGNAQGTSYHISYVSQDKIVSKKQIDSLLADIDRSMSAWIPNSIISRINNNEKDVIIDDYFRTVFNKAVEVSDKTKGDFDITVGPLINAWGFGPATKKTLNKRKLDSLLPLVNYKMLSLQHSKIVKEKPEIKIDFNAIAQGYSVDVLADFFQKKGITNYLVELGGEIKSNGKKIKEEWKVGIEQPDEENASDRKLQAIVNLGNRALATSGNYRKFYREGNQKFSHIINPKTGYPAKHNLLSTTVIANDAITADAYATAFMVMGLQKSIDFVEKNKELNLEVFFIYDEKGKWKTYISPGLMKRIKTVS
ncbi:FAD:protein FMN transferase [Flavobacterium sp. ST-87]|uniref:FAD:protein FMN transferase n=1 Tax=Flavobacterium plantiphilum TaxID=3163297 RepID=A0ABW8XP99_9FLAO